MVASWFSVLLASGALTIELAASGRGGFFQILSLMALVHAAIGLGEAVITGMVVRFLLVRRPDLFETPVEPGAAGMSLAHRWGQTLVGGLAVALAIAVFVAPFASDSPDGLEFVGEKLGFSSEASPAPSIPAPIPDYQLPGLKHVKMATAAAGLLGTLAVFGVAWGMARVLTRLTGKEATLDAA
jgi:cobalt/nickel transport system permease protein